MSQPSDFAWHGGVVFIFGLVLMVSILIREIWRRLENQRAYVDKWNGQLPSVQSGQGMGLLMQLPKQE